jgi:beta-lactam-binding protein with PASTA domain
VASGFTVHEIYETNNKVDAGKAIRTDPPGSSQVFRASTISLYVSTGPRTTRPSSFPNVYDWPRDKAEQQLAAVGFKTRIINVCSHSVAVGQVRQVILADRSPEVVLVDKAGPTDAARGVKTDQPVALKISTGVPCN